MEKIYIAFVDTPGFFASIIRKVLRQKYVHVVLSLDQDLNEAYSFGRRNPRVPIIAGFEKEEKEKVWSAFPQADYMVCSMECEEEQKQYIEQELRQAYQKRFSYHYAVAGLPFILMQKPFFQKNHYTCSSYVARILEDAGVCQWEKDFSLVTPKDFYERTDKKIVFEGKLAELIREEKVVGKAVRLRKDGLSRNVAYGQ